MRRVSIPRLVGLTAVTLLVALAPTWPATAVDSWAVEIGPTGSVLGGGAGLSIPVTVTCPAGYAQYKSLHLRANDRKGNTIGIYFESHFPCDGTAHTLRANMVSGTPVRRGDVWVRAGVSCAEQCGDQVTDAKMVELTTDPVDLDSTPVLEVAPTGTLLGGNQARVSATVTCDAGLHSRGNASVSLHQRRGSGVAHGYGGAPGEAVCDGAPHTVDFVINSSSSPFRAGDALAMASILLCPEGQTVSPGGSGPGCGRISEAAEVRILR